MTDQDHENMRDYLDGKISPANLDELNRLLENDTNARARFRALATMEEGIRELAETPMRLPSRTDPVGLLNQQGSFAEPTLSVRKRDRVITAFFSRPLIAAAAGLMIGVFCTSAIWATSGAGRQKIFTLIHESFESSPAPNITGIPLEPEVWSGDFSKVVTAQEAIAPKHGNRMLKLLRADHAGKEAPVGYVGDLYRVIDLREHESMVAGDDAVISVESAFGSIPVESPDRFVCGIAIHALNTLPIDENGWRQLMEIEHRLEEESLASARRWITLSPGDPAWRSERTELRLPMKSRYVVIAIHVSDRSAIQPEGEPLAVEFSGKFLDDIRVELSRRESGF